MSRNIPLEEAAARLSELVRSLRPDEEVILTQDDEPVAKIVPQQRGARAPRKPGTARGMLTIVSEDDQHLDDFRRYMCGTD